MARQRIQFFLDDDQYDTVARIAKAQDRAIPELVHDLVDLGLERIKPRARTKQEALQELTLLRRSIEARQGVHPGDPVAEARAERERQMDAALSTVDEP
jgi:hypothetical protein